LSKKIYIGNLSFNTTDAELRRLFEQHGSVDSVSVIMDRETGRPRGFAFVEMSDASSAAAAIQTLNGRELDGRSLRVNEAQERGAGGGGGGFGGGGGGGGGYGGGGRR
jgi:RNA recognition motif-containing protein